MSFSLGDMLSLMNVGQGSSSKPILTSKSSFFFASPPSSNAGGAGLAQAFCCFCQFGYTRHPLLKPWENSSGMIVQSTLGIETLIL